MFKFKEVSKSTEIIEKITDAYNLKTKSLENEITQITKLLIQDGSLIEAIDLNCLEQENLISYCNSDFN